MTKFTRESIGTLIIPRPSRSIVDAFLALEQLTPDCCDILEELGHTHGFTPATILHPVQEFMRVVGPALTILNGPGSSELWPHEYQDLFLVAQPGDVVVIAGGGHEHATGWGGTTTRIATELGLAGTVMNHPCRDWEAVRRMEYPVWCRGTSPLSPKRFLEAKEMLTPVEIMGVSVKPGDLVVADMSGVVVIPYELIPEVLARLEAGRAT